MDRNHELIKFAEEQHKLSLHGYNAVKVVTGAIEILTDKKTLWPQPDMSVADAAMIVANNEVVRGCHSLEEAYNALNKHAGSHLEDADNWQREVFSYKAEDRDRGIKWIEEHLEMGNTTRDEEDLLNKVLGVLYNDQDQEEK